MSNFKKRLAGVIAAATAAICLSGTMVGASLKNVKWDYTDSNNVRHFQASYAGSFAGYNVEKNGTNVYNQLNSTFYAHHYYNVYATNQHDFLTLIVNKASDNRYINMNPTLYNAGNNAQIEQSSWGGVAPPYDGPACNISIDNSQLPVEFKMVYSGSIYTSSSSYSPVATRYTFTEFGLRS